MQSPEEIIALWQNGLITIEEAQHALEAVNVHGGFNEEGYTGYDYARQQWIITKDEV